MSISAREIWYESTERQGECFDADEARKAVAEWLERAPRVDGLWQWDGPCWCHRDDLAPCGEMRWDCVAAQMREGGAMWPAGIYGEEGEG